MAWWTISNAQGLNQRANPLTDGGEGVVLEAENVGFFNKGACVQRFATTDQSLAGSGFTGSVEWLGSYTTNAGVAERWGAANNSGSAALARNDGTWSPVTFSDSVNASNLRYITADALNGKYFIAYDSDVNRMHVWDGTTLRRAGFATCTTPSVAQDGGGGLSFTRYYRARYVELSGTTVVRRSEASASVSITIAAKAGVTVTKGATINEGETHWEIEAASASAGPWYRIARQAVTVTTYDDTSATISTTDLSADAGAYLPPPSAKYCLSDGNRMIYAGAWETTSTTGETAPKQNRVWFTPALGSTGEGDEERIPDTVDQENWIDIGDPGPITGLAGPMYGDVYVFKNDSVWKLVATGDVDNPYRKILITAASGAVDQRVIVQAENGDGVPAIFYATANNVYMLSQSGIIDISEGISRDVRLVTFTAAQSVLDFDPLGKCLFAQTNTSASGTAGQYYQFNYDLSRKQWSGISIGGAQTGWILGRSILGTDTTLASGTSAIACAVVAPTDQGSTRLLLGGTNSSSTSWITAWGDSCAADGSSAFTTRQRIRRLAKPGSRFRVGAATLMYRSPSGTTSTTGTLTLSYIREDGVTQTQTQTLTATTSDDGNAQNRIVFDALQMDNCTALDVRTVWTYTAGFQSTVPPSIDAILIPIDENESEAA